MRVRRCEEILHVSEFTSYSIMPSGPRLVITSINVDVIVRDISDPVGQKHTEEKLRR